MPILDSLTYANDLPDVDRIRRPVVACGLVLEAPDLELKPHSHRKSQFLLSSKGVLTCDVGDGLWLVPPGCAIWIPGGTRHSIKASGVIEGYNAMVEPDKGSSMPRNSCTVFVSPLLRELMIATAALPLEYAEGGRNSDLVSLLLSEMAVAPVENVHMPVPKDERLRRILDMMLDDPSDRSTMAIWAQRAGLSERTLARLLIAETGMSFGRWRQQLSIMLALQWMAQGTPVNQVSFALGYENPSSFVTMFRNVLGSPPAKYMSVVRGGDPLNIDVVSDG